MTTSSVNHLEWRYATKKFDPAKKISEKELQEILESLRLAPSSFGLQPWKFLVIEDPKIRQALVEHSWNQSQVAEASHLIVLCGLKTLDAAYVKKYIHDTVQTRGVTEESLAGYEQMMLGFVKKLSPEQLKSWTKNQVYLALGFLMSECARRKIDTCPMEGFDSEAYDQILNLKALDLHSVVLCPIGHRAADDKHAALKKVRFSAEHVIVRR